MKRILALLLTVIMVFALTIPSFAAKSVKFIVKTVSETDNEIVISIDYDSGTPFSCFDIEVTYNEKKLKVLEAYDGDGLDAFVRYAKKNEGAASFSLINRDNNPIKHSMAITVPFKIIDGKDLFVARFAKLSKDKVKSSDIKVVFTNCGTDTGKLKVTVVNTIGGGSVIETAPTTSKSNANDTTKTSDTKKTEAKTNDATVSSTSDKKEDASSLLTSEKTDIEAVSDTENKADGMDKSSDSENEAVGEKTNNKNKIIVVSAIAVCLIFVIIAVCVYISKKSKKEE